MCSIEKGTYTSHSILEKYLVVLYQVVHIVRVYLVGYIFCIIDYHICQDIFGRIYIMYYRLPFVFRDTLPLKTLVLYIYRSRGIMQYKQ
jgi:hypothetical protein